MANHKLQTALRYASLVTTLVATSGRSWQESTPIFSSNSSTCWTEMRHKTVEVESPSCKTWSPNKMYIAIIAVRKRKKKDFWWKPRQGSAMSIGSGVALITRSEWHDQGTGKVMRNASINTIRHVQCSTADFANLVAALQKNDCSSDIEKRKIACLD